MGLLGRYKNGNFVTTILSDGTKIRETKDDEFIPSFAENMDVKICNYCDMGCKFCHEGSSLHGKFGDILNEKFIDTLHPYQEIAIGGGDATSHPNLIPFLQKLKERSDIKALENNNLKMLILGYKHLRRGNEYFEEEQNDIETKQQWLYENLEDIIQKFKVVSFDNLAIEQLNVKRLLTQEEWDEFYMGDDGKVTYYVDMVERKFAQSSTAPFDKRYDLLDSVDDMFHVITNL